MAETTQHQRIRKKLLEILEPHLPGIEIDVGQARRWKRLTLTFRHERFGPLLPEQRFRSLLQMIPTEFYEGELRGAVWFELAPGEKQEDILRARRSDDVADDEPAIAQRLFDVGYFEALEKALGPRPVETCGGDFAKVREVLAAQEIVEAEQRDACLVFIRQGAYCDCDVLLAAKPALAKLYGTP
ncbi:MAG: hypothetical protein GY778_26185 [bacterium]|nr:hypothetical protein [bacterium]